MKNKKKMKNFGVGFSILTCLILINCQNNIKNKNFYYLGAGVKSKIFQLEFSFFGDYAKIMVENTCRGKPIEFLEYKVENIDSNTFTLKLITKPFNNMKWQEIYDTCYFKEKQTTATYLEDLLMAKQISGRKLIIQNKEKTIRIKVSDNSYFVYEK